MNNKNQKSIPSIKQYYNNLYNFLIDWNNNSPYYDYKDNNHIIEKVDLSFPDVYQNNINSSTRDYINNLKEFLDSQSEIENIIFHGSYGDYTNINYSDVDLTLVINENVLNNHEKLRKLKQNILRIIIPLSFNLSPFQHHGPFILWQGLITAYDENILPLVAYNDSWAIYKKEYSFSIIKKIKPKISDLRNTILLQGEKAFKTNNLYDYYLFLSNIMLFPTIYLQSKGYHISKKESFDIIQKNSDFTFISLASRIRKRWVKNNISKFLIRILLFINNYRKPFKISRFCGYISWNNFKKAEIENLHYKFKIETENYID